MGGLEAGSEVAKMSKRQRDFCIIHRDGKSTTESLSLALLACLVYVGIFGEVAHGEMDAYQQLELYGFPVGLLPRTVTDYDLADNGKFALYLESKCQVDLPDIFPVVYNKKITGKLSYQSLRDLSGIQVKIYFFWISITAISVQGDKLKFEAGIISASYDIHPDFDTINPYCVNTNNPQPLSLAAE